MEINIGDISATCGRCGGKDFQPLSAGALRLATELKCTSCGNKVKYLVLLDQTLRVRSVYVAGLPTGPG